MTKQLTQEEADALLAMKKYFRGSERFNFPALGDNLRIPLDSKDRREEFTLDINSSSIRLEKNTFQTRTRKVIILARLDLGGAPHRNPDDEIIECPHLHVYREGYGDKWAHALPEEFDGIKDTLDMMDKFLDYCHVVGKPAIDRGIYT